jgi:hypothetical protein
MPVIPATLEAEIRRIMIQVQSRQTVSKTSSQQISWAWWHTTAIPATWQVKIGGWWSETIPWQNLKTLSKKQLKQNGWGYGSSGRVLV